MENTDEVKELSVNGFKFLTKKEQVEFKALSIKGANNWTEAEKARYNCLALLTTRLAGAYADGYKFGFMYNPWNTRN